MIPSFRFPWLLLLIVVPVAIMAWHVMRDDRRIIIPVDHAGNRHGYLIRTLLTFFEWMTPIALAIAIIILAGPTTLSEPQAERNLTNIEFCVDVSGSMTAQMGEGTRYDASMAAIKQFVDTRKGDAFGLTFFGNEVLHWVPVTKDTSAITCAIPFMDPKLPTHPPWLGGTEIGKALRACRKRLIQQEEGDRMIVLVSDGYSSDLSGGNDMLIAQELSNDGITVFSIHVAEGEAPGEVANLAIGTGGEVFPTSDPDALEVIFKRIDQMKPATMKNTTVSTLDYYEPFAYVGLTVIGLAIFASFGLRYTPW